jgi:MerR family transcriptional regulator, copper efflux regulator
MALLQIRPGGSDLKIGDLAKATGKTQRALRLYEELGLLTPGTRTEGGFRLYGPDAVERVAWISKLQELGFTLQQIQQLVDVTAAKEGMATVRALYEAKQAEVAAQIERLQQLQRELTASLEYLETCVHECAADCCAHCESHAQDQAPSLVEGIRS